MNATKSLTVMVVLMILAGCEGKSSNKSKYEPQNEIVNSPSSIDEEKTYTTDTTMGYTEMDKNLKMNPLSSSAATYRGDTNRRFIKTADLKFRVNSVITSTYAIEDLTANYGGFVTHTHLDSRIDNTTLVPVSADSSLETVYYTVTNSITLRIPERNLDSMLRAFTPMVEYLDHRTIDVRDVYIEMLVNQLTQARVRNQQQGIQNNVDSKGNNLRDMNESEDMIINRQAQADEAKINNLMLKDQMEFSTISILTYQRQSIKREMIYNNKNIEAYEPGFGYKLKRSFINGWRGIQAIVIFFAQFWVMIPLLLIGYIVYRVIRRK